jgi:uncharacterized protein
MSNIDTQEFIHPRTRDVEALVREELGLIHVLAGPRQVGKSTAARQIRQHLGWEAVAESADSPVPLGPEWIRTQWERAAKKAAKGQPCLLILDEVQKVSGWSETLKSLWDAREGLRIQVLVLGSSALLVQKGLSESLAGRFLLHRFTHWSPLEMRQAFGMDLEDWFFFGGYPGAARLRHRPELWRCHVRDSLAETAVARDVLQMAPVRKPTLLRNLFGLACLHPAESFSYTKMLGCLQDAGNTVTLASYLDLLEGAFLVAGLESWRPGVPIRRGSSPKLVVLNNALAAALSGRNRSELERDRSWRGRMIENAVIAHLVQGLDGTGARLRWWRDGHREVDLVVESGEGLWAVEIKSGKAEDPAGLREFLKRWPTARPLVVGSGGIPFEEFFAEDPVERFGR